MLYLLKALLDSREIVAGVWIFGGMVAVFLICLCVALYAALFHPDPKVRESAKGIFKMILGVLTKDRNR